jgi:glycerophosphoryl diester phosphodiesterase
MAPTAVQAHRGSPDPAAGERENTLEAFARARRLGADGIELDVRLTADGALAVVHDPVVADAGPVHELAAGRLPPWVPTLPEALDACEGTVVNIEIKNLPGEDAFDPAEAVAGLVADAVVAAGRVGSVVVSSFWPGSLDAVRAAQPRLSTGLLVASWFDPSGCVAAALAHGCSAIHPHVGLVTIELVGEAHAAGLSVAAWTVSDREGLLAVAHAGVDTVITDDVALARDVLGASGAAGSA